MYKRLEGHKYSQCEVYIDEKQNITFISYVTNVIYAIKNKNGLYNITCTGTYSATTRKQIGYFLSEYFPSLNYYDIKAIAYTDKVIKDVERSF